MANSTEPTSMAVTAVLLENMDRKRIHVVSESQQSHSTEAEGCNTFCADSSFVHDDQPALAGHVMTLAVICHGRNNTSIESMH